MIAKSVVALSILVISMSTAHATVWSDADVDKALATIAKQESGARECAAGTGTKIGHEVIQKDIDGDGVSELEVRSFPEELKNGSSGCYSPAGQAITLFRTDGAGGWIAELGFDAMELKYHPRPRGGWPDVELIGGSAGMTGIVGCGPIWRFHNGRYGPWKVCDDNGRQIFADVAPWMKAGDAVPRDSGEESATVEVPASVPEPIEINGLRGPEFDHNGSVMIVDHTRGLIIYKEPKKSITGAVKPGDVLFKGEPWDQYELGRPIGGTAYLFKKGCDPVPYQVSGGFRTSWHTIILKGAAPVRAKGSCDVTEYKNNGNSLLEFQNLDD